MVLITPTHHWVCPSCGLEDATHELQPHLRMHACPKRGGLVVGMVPAGTRAEHRVVERQDYVGDEQVTTDAEGRPVMSVITERDDGYDTAVYAPVAKVRSTDP